MHPRRHAPGAAQGSPRSLWNHPPRGFTDGTQFVFTPEGVDLFLSAEAPTLQCNVRGLQQGNAS